MKPLILFICLTLLVACRPPVSPPDGGDPDGGNPDSGTPPDGGVVDAGCGTCRDVLTYHNDNARTGQYLAETTLTHANVNPTRFGKRFFLAVDGKVDAQPLYRSGISILGQGVHNVLFVATEHGTVYAFDADANAPPLWKTSLLGAGEVPGDGHGCTQVVPEIGITATPVIDAASGTLYAVAMSKSTGSGAYFQRIHALDLSTGQERTFSPVTVQATYPGTGDNTNGTQVVFDPGQYKERPALLLSRGVLYTSWSSHCDVRPYTAWVMAYNPSTLAQVSVLNLTPNGNEGAMWASGAGPAADDSGNLFLMTGNGTFDTTLNAGFPASSDYGNAFVKLSTNNGLAVADYFAAFDTVSDSAADTDLGSGGLLLLPDAVGSSAHRHLLVGAGKNHNIYLLDRDQLGHFNPNNNDQIVQELVNALGVPGTDAEFGMPAYFNNALYYGAVADSLKAFSLSGGRLSTAPTSTTSQAFGYPGTTPSLSANPSDLAGTAIVWAHENTNPAVLHAYPASDLSVELYNSNQAAGGRDHFGAGNKFIVPTVANGKVYVGTTNGVAVFGLLP